MRCASSAGLRVMFSAQQMKWRCGLVFGAVLLWKLLLLVFTDLPLPSNDSFFYDGAVVNLLRHGSYTNPALAQALPISGTQVFSAYPPLYQWSLMPWMWLFGSSALSTMYYHLLLFAIYALLVLAVLHRLSRRDDRAGERGCEAFHIAGLYLLTITFHDRPDSLAHVFGIGAVYAWIRWLQSCTVRGGQKQEPSNWAWVMALAALLSLGTGLQIGSLYFGVVWLGTLVARLGQSRCALPVLPLATMIVVPVLIVLWVARQHPVLLEGFLEHARITPAITGVRIPRLDELLKVGRAAPGIFAVAAIMFVAGWRKWIPLRPEPLDAKDPLLVVLIATGLPSLGLLIAALFFVTPNAGSFTMYLQPVIVGALLLLLRSGLPFRWNRAVSWCFVGLAGLGAIRAIGLSTWGVACAFDYSGASALARVREEVLQVSREEIVVLSSAYLYEASKAQQPAWVHCDWLNKPGPSQLQSDLEGLTRVRPRKLILTQFDYFRRYETLLHELSRRNSGVKIAISSTSNVPAPDSFPALRRVVQHISWAPVVVTLQWIE